MKPRCPGCVIWLLALFAICNACPPQSQPYRRLSLKHDDSGVAALRTALDGAIAAVVANTGVWPQFDATNSSFSIAVTSDVETLWETHHTPRHFGEYRDGDAPTEITRNTIYRIASNTKIYTVLALLLTQKRLRREGGVVFELTDVVTKYLPELKRRVLGGESEGPEDEQATIDWDSVTLEALASQLSDIPRDYGVWDSWLEGRSVFATHDHYGVDEVLRMGYADLSQEEGLPSCGTGPQIQPCSMEELLSFLHQAAPIANPFELSSYSNLNFVLLAEIMQRLTNRTIEEIMEREIFRPLKLSQTLLHKPQDSLGAIPTFENNAWRIDFGWPLRGSGDVYTSSHDFIKFVRAILNHTFLRESELNSWLRPRSFSANGMSFYGMPWEIFRSDKLTRGGVPLAMYQKTGHLLGYRSEMVLIPEYNVGMTLMVTGDDIHGHDALLTAILETAIPRLEEVMRQATKAHIGGFYQATDGNSSMRIQLDPERGMKLTQWISSGHEFLSTYRTVEAQSTNANDQLSILPMRVDDGEDTEVWTIGLDVSFIGQKKWYWSSACQRDIAGNNHGGQSMSRITAYKRNGEIISLRHHGLRVTLERVKDHALPDLISTLRSQKQHIASNPNMTWSLVIFSLLIFLTTFSLQQWRREPPHGTLEKNSYHGVRAQASRKDKKQGF